MTKGRRGSGPVRRDSIADEGDGLRDGGVYRQIRRVEQARIRRRAGLTQQHVEGGQIAPAPCQSSAADGVRVVEDEQLIKSVMKKPQDLKFDATAFTRAPLYGRKLAAGCPL